MTKLCETAIQRAIQHLSGAFDTPSEAPSEAQPEVAESGTLGKSSPFQRVGFVCDSTSPKSLVGNQGEAINHTQEDKASSSSIGNQQRLLHTRKESDHIAEIVRINIAEVDGKVIDAPCEASEPWPYTLHGNQEGLRKSLKKESQHGRGQIENELETEDERHNEAVIQAADCLLGFNQNVPEVDNPHGRVGAIPERDRKSVV